MEKNKCTAVSPVDEAQTLPSKPKMCEVSVTDSFAK